MCRERGRRLNGVDIVLGQSFGWGDREAGPHDRIWIDGRYEEGEGGSWDIEGEMTIGKGTASEIEEVPPLTAPPSQERFISLVNTELQRGEGKFVPEWLILVIILQEAGFLAFNIDRCGTSGRIVENEILSYFFSMCFGGVFTRWDLD